MNVVVSFSDGQRAEGILLAAGRFGLRVLFPGNADVTEFHYQYGQWTSADSEAVELEGLFSESCLDYAYLNPEIFHGPQSLEAGVPAN
jgi:hypothetical protein